MYCTVSSPALLVTVSQQAAPSTSAELVPEAEVRDQGFQPVTGNQQMASGEVLLVQAYAVMWLLAFGLILSSMRQQRKLDARITQLREDLDKVRKAQD